ncbi:MAG TPA: tryptophan--tRNA ligase [Patescibacteria group bacterium]|nr:tryptophan--tRNA ligase [Patescibacteria group bacterium]
MSKLVILTGIRANNDLHIGNYVGGIKPIIDMAKSKSKEYQINLFIPDLHSFTTPIDYSTFQKTIQNNIKMLVAAGLPINIETVDLYRQSFIPAHSELTWILDNFTSFGELQRMTQFKDKSAQLKSDRVSVGLFNYPVLMASDILLYGATYIPVGDDQTQHLEFTRDIADRFNKQFNGSFIVPKPVSEQHKFFGKDQGLRIKDLSDPTKKMSKSSESSKGVIFLNDDISLARQKILSATTDSLNKINYDQKLQPGISNLIELLALFTDKSTSEILNKYNGQTQYGPLKNEVADVICEFLEELKSNISKVSSIDIDQKLTKSESKMNVIANSKLLEVQKAIGLR